MSSGWILTDINKIDIEQLRKYALDLAETYKREKELHKALEMSHDQLKDKIIELEKANQELDRHRKHLEVLVEERTVELTEANASLEKNNKDLKHFNELFVDREHRINELRERVKELEEKLGQTRDD